MTINYSNHSGTSKVDAIVITGALNGTEGVRAEYAYLEEKYGKKGEAFNLIKQSLLVDDETKRTFDLLEIQLSNDQTMKIYFDISDFFGKY